MGDYEIEIDESTSRILDALINAGDDALSLAKIAEIDPEEFREFLSECGEMENKDALELLRAAEVLRFVRREAAAEAVFQSREGFTYQTKSSFAVFRSRMKYFFLGGGIGAVIALFFAPKSGQELRGDLADATRKGIDKSREAAQQLGERAGEYYESTRERAGELYTQAATKASDIYSQASEKVGEVAQMARETATRKTSTVADAIDPGKKAYLEEKGKAESKDRVEAAPTYDKELN